MNRSKTIGVTLLVIGVLTGIGTIGSWIALGLVVLNVLLLAILTTMVVLFFGYVLQRGVAPLKVNQYVQVGVGNQKLGYRGYDSTYYLSDKTIGLLKEHDGEPLQGGNIVTHAWRRYLHLLGLTGLGYPWSRIIPFSFKKCSPEKSANPNEEHPVEETRWFIQNREITRVRIRTAETIDNVKISIEARGFAQLVNLDLYLYGQDSPLNVLENVFEGEGRQWVADLKPRPGGDATVELEDVTYWIRRGTDGLLSKLKTSIDDAVEGAGFEWVERQVINPEPDGSPEDLAKLNKLLLAKTTAELEGQATFTRDKYAAQGIAAKGAAEAGATAALEKAKVAGVKALRRLNPLSPEQNVTLGHLALLHTRLASYTFAPGRTPVIGGTDGDADS